jgi:hypothetical protein
MRWVCCPSGFWGVADKRLRHPAPHSERTPKLGWLARGCASPRRMPHFGAGMPEGGPRDTFSARNSSGRSSRCSSFTLVATLLLRERVISPSRRQ